MTGRIIDIVFGSLLLLTAMAGIVLVSPVIISVKIYQTWQHTAKPSRV